MFPTAAPQTTKGPAPWPAEWGSEHASSRDLLPIIGFGVLGVILALSLIGALAVGTAGGGQVAFGIAAFGAMVIPVITQRVALLRRRRSDFSPRITLVDLDMSSGAITPADAASPPAPGRGRGVLVPLSRRGTVALLAQITSSFVAVLWMAAGGFLLLRHHGDGSINWTGSIGSIAIWLCIPALLIVLARWIRGRLQPGRGLSRLILTPDGLWFTGSLEQLWLPWGAVTAVRAVTAKTRIAIDFTSGVHPVSQRTKGDWVRLAHGPAHFAPLLYDLDAALLLVMLRQVSTDPQLQAELATPAAINRLAGTYTHWHQARTTYPPASWSPQ